MSRTVARKSTAVLFALALAPFGETATKDSHAPDREMLKMMELLRQMEMIKEIDMLRDMDRLENGAPAAAPRKAPPSKKPEISK